MFLVALALAVIGLSILLLIAPEGDEQRYVLRGTVVEREGRSATVATNMTVVGRNLGGTIEREVFWNGNEFIAVS